MANAGISGSDVRDIMLEAVETRFGSLRATSPVEILSDNDSAYTARETRICARQRELHSCFTPVQSPQLNGIADAFVHTLNCCGRPVLLPKLSEQRVRSTQERRPPEIEPECLDLELGRSYFLLAGRAPLTSISRDVGPHRMIRCSSGPATYATSPKRGSADGPQGLKEET